MNMILGSISLFLLSVSAEAGVIVVSPSGPYTDIQPAVDVAGDGDVLLIKSGSYSGFIIQNKALTVVADLGAAAYVAGAVRVDALQATRTVIVAGLAVTGVYGGNPLAAHGAHVTNCSGSVRFQDCVLDAAVGTGGFCDAPHSGALVEVSIDVAFTRCQMKGDSALPAPFPLNTETGRGGSGLASTASRVALYDCVVRGGKAGDDFGCFGGYGYGDGFQGPPGIDADSSSILASSTNSRGGDGGNVGSGINVCGRGGTGLFAHGSSDVHVLGSSFTSGNTGSGIYCGLAPLPPTVVTAPALLETLTGAPVHFSMDRVVRSGSSGSIRFDGLSQDLIAAYWALSGNWEYSPEFRGVYLARLPPAGRFLRYGTIDATGVAIRPLISPILPPGVTSRVYQTQSLHRDAAGQYRLGPPDLIVVLDPAY